MSSRQTILVVSRVLFPSPLVCSWAHCRRSDSRKLLRRLDTNNFSSSILNSKHSGRCDASRDHLHVRCTNRFQSLKCTGSTGCPSSRTATNTRIWRALQGLGKQDPVGVFLLISCDRFQRTPSRSSTCQNQTTRAWL